MALKILLLIILSIGISTAAFYSPSYTVVAPKILKPGNKYLFSLTSKTEKTADFELEASIKASAGSVLVKNKFNLQTNSGLCSRRHLYVFSECIRRDNFRQQQKAVYQQEGALHLHPNRQVLFRVIAVTPDLKPFGGKINVTVYDTAENKIKKLVDQQSENVFNIPVLPKFEVTVDLPSYFLYNRNQPSLQDPLLVSVIAKYTYGKPVKGTARVEVTIDTPYWHNKEEPKFTKLIHLTDGKGDLSLSLTELKTLIPASHGGPTLAGRTFFVEANVTETETGITLSGNNTVQCKTERFKLEFLSNSPDNFKPGLNYYGYLSLKKNDLSPLTLSDIQNSDGSFKTINVTASYYDRKIHTNAETLLSLPLTENGFVVFTIPTLKESGSVFFQVSFKDEITNSVVSTIKEVSKFLTRDKGGIQLSLLNEENLIKPSTTLQFKVKTIDLVEEIQFQVLAKGFIIAEKQIVSATAQTEHSFSMHVTDDLSLKLAPEARFVVSYATPSGELIADSLALPVADYFANKISLSFSKNVSEPGDENVYLNVKTKENSFVGLLAVDRSVMLLSSGNDVTQDMRLLISNKDMIEDVFSEFHENQNVGVKDSADGVYQLKVKVPDTITSWVATGFSINREAGLGLTESSAELTVVKPFFISLNLPYSIVRGEEFALQVTVFNYFGQDLETQVKLLASNYFKVIKCDNKELQSVEVVKHLKVGNNDGKSVYFWVVATAIGQIPIEVSAHAGLAADAMKATLLVKVSDIIGSAMNNIGDLLKMPYGCGEQNLLHLVPDVYLLKYFTETGRLTQEFDQKAKNFINDGYQRELTYQRLDGSFSAFGNSDKAGSIWLSSFVIKCFHQAKEYIPVEDSKIAATMNWIIGLQGTDGTFAEPPEGKVIHKDMQGGSSSGIALTAYVLIALLENKNNPMTNSARLTSAINNANKYLENNFHSYSNDPYALAIISYALHKSGSLKLTDTLALLDKLAINKDGVTYWKKDVIESTSEGIWRGPYSQAKSYNIEIASYVLMVYAEKKDFSKSIPIGKWLLKQRNAFGGFASTQDTVLGLEALASFAPLIIPSSDGAGITVTVTDESGSFSHTFDTVTRQNALFLQSIQLPQSTSLAYLLAEGEGVALVQMNVKYNVENDNKDQFLTLDLSTSSSNNDLSLSVSTSWSGSEVTGMVVVEINILTGYSLLDDGNFIQQIGSTFKKVEKSSNKVVIYLDELTSQPLKFDVLLQEQLKIANVKPALVKVYRYYEPGTPVTGFYSTVSGQTWEGACPQCC
ncbi:hypothetical protein HELRODRAFT_172868 [Helobdella robusta]|uniref:Alpha-2-macroglobulin domain-containing protein n=1 Tax=Helobdella robusta TaxID=6412 RepID=T1F618_HELRO|nr:hypothetical protein HELRODRAFT_172868 [Helobdella robusta]ESO03843.1 hypothetical protein HELRODRAFT_172868 [Helobdella robusta]